jgi:hypothetical protein
MTIQHYLFERALKEEGIEKKDFVLKHDIPANYNNGKKYPFVFPKSFLKEVQKLDYSKKTDYFFAGTINCKGNHREYLKKWNKPNSLIITPRENKFIHPSNDPTGYYSDNFFNINYFQQLANTKFALAPGGCSYDVKRDHFAWTYRFWEAVLVKAIPITNEPDKNLHLGYKFYSLDEEHIYRKDWTEYNFNKLKKENFIWTED